MTERECPSCGEKCPPKGKLCPHCGNKMPKKSTLTARLGKFSDPKFKETAEKNCNRSRYVDQAHVAVAKLGGVGYQPVLFYAVPPGQRSKQWKASHFKTFELVTEDHRNVFGGMEMAYNSILRLNDEHSSFHQLEEAEQSEMQPGLPVSPRMAEGYLMEVCVDSVESAVNAERGGAGRLELCSSLLEGGLTPTVGLLEVVKRYVKIPVYVMIRPRGGDFLYSDREVEVMRKDMELMKSHGADGLVLGALTEDGRIDAQLCMELLAASRPLPVTFHRAFDMAHDPVVALETLISLGFERLLTSGCDSSALEGLPTIRRLVEQAKGRIIIMPGGGITERNLQRILEGSGAQEFHCSARSSKDSSMKFRNSSVTMGASFSAPEYGLKVADVTKVRNLNAIAKNTL